MKARLRDRAAGAVRRRPLLVVIVAVLGLGGLVCTPPAIAANLAVQQTAEFTGSDTASGDTFGFATAMSGSLLAVGAPHHGGGEVYIFTQSGGSWTQTAELTGSDTASGDAFGQAVALSVTSTSTTLVVGAEGHNGARGAVYVFTLSGTTWSQAAELTQPGSPNYGQLGWSVAISGSTMVAGAPNVNGAVFVYKRSSLGVWAQSHVITATDGSSGDLLGWDVGLAGSSTVLATAPGHNGTGTLYVFQKVSGRWSQTQELTGSDTASGDMFGDGALSVSGANALVGAPFHASQAGAVYVFTNTSGTWAQSAELTASDATSNDHFGLGAAISGKHIVVGADRHASITGNAYLFTLGLSGWTQKKEFTGSDSVAGDAFGRTVAMSGTTTEISATLKAPGGEAYIFTV